MAKSKNLLLTEATTMRMMGLAGIGSLANPFLREMKDGYCESCGQMESKCKCEGKGEEEDELDEIIDPVFGNAEEMDEGYEEDELDEMMGMDHMGGEEEEEEDEEEEYEEEDEEEEEEEESEEDPDARSYDEDWRGGKIDMSQYYEGKKLSGSTLQENVHRSMKRLKRLLEQAEETPPPEGAEPPEGGAEPPPAMEGGGEMEDKIKEFVKKLGELVQETLGVQVTVEEQEEEPEGGAEAPPTGGAGAPPPPPPPAGAAPAPLAEAINRLVNKVARRVKARLMEAKKESEKKKLSKKELEDLEGLEKHYGEEMRAGIKGKHSHKSRMKDIEAAKSNLKEKQMAAKKKEMMMKKKKAAMAKKKVK